ncbi:phenylalanine--tRNA ligase subunit beta [Marinospirillum alkaliphilum]|uniref:Phenylalanine--tRNA ligase beta subunit n=1 Tax=Marinospirillum alkaliphilum DSM 21637 TaxID=1122209 RepID=A0A1K1XPT0_9GAMM|nr:phenylalanine--tRNA ligase subunit beta [Marinospirillum alkaliphilum]SFX51608.1 phenylalanyl-tRNA synthetase beta subunit [Marinospirillum alkaliphilum DSM 21637]
MKFSEQWLREWVNPALDAAALDEQLSLAGLEVDSREPAAGQFSGVVVGEIISAEPHPNADKLQVCQVSDGVDTHQVVCGAPNARAGLKTAFARVGAVLPGDFKIKQAKLRQVESCGMLSSEQELGLSDNHDGIMELAADAPVGHDLRDYLKLDDQIFDVDLTPNRSDCLSIAGLAREVGVLNRIAVTQPVLNRVAPQIDDQPQITLEAPVACPRYLGRILRGINIKAATPLWMQEKLRRSGIRSIDPVVDVTNYVMLELGQPMHAFDLAEIDGVIRVRMAQPEEKLTLLDGSELTLKPETLVIADNSKALALAGIMGGEHSGCSPETRDILLEVAYFDPLSLAGKAREYGLHTDASHRFERGVDFQLQQRAMERATELLLQLVGGQPGPITEAVANEHLPVRQPVKLRKDRLEQLLAIRLPDAEVVDILTRLGMVIEDQGDAWLAAVPSYRFDISIEVDLIEEVARVYGYDNLPVRAPSAAMLIQNRPESEVSLRRIRNLLTSRGYQEAITYSFIDPKWSQAFDPERQPIALANPISADLAVMRTSLLPGLAKALSYNQKRQQPRVRLFETGLRFIREGETTVQQPMLAGLISGSRHPESWTGKTESVDFFDIKGDFEALLSLTGDLANWQFRTASHPALHPGQSAEILHRQQDGSWQSVGWIGALHPQLCKDLDLRGQTLVFEVVQEAVMQGRVPRFGSLSRFPEMRRDLALLVDASQPVGELLQEAWNQGGEWLQKVTLFDVYQGQGIAEGKKSLALGLTWQHPSRTLTDDEINSQVNQVVTAFSQGFAAELRS